MSRLFSAVIVAAGFALGGWFVSHGFELRRAERVVTVKCLAERNVKADLALWPLRYAEAGNDLADVQARIQKDTAAVQGFLAAHSLGQAIACRNPQVTDRAAQQWGESSYKQRFVITATLLVRSRDVGAVDAAAQDTRALIEQGVALAAGNEGPGSGGPSYVFTQLNAIKPELIAEATRNARAAAQQFAHDFGSRVGGIVRASQGVIEILPRDAVPGAMQQQQIDKTVRVVATLDYALER